MFSKSKLNKFFFGQKSEKILRYICFALFVILVVTMPIFTYREGLNFITIIFAIVFGVFVFTYILFFGTFKLSIFVIFNICYLFFSFASTILNGVSLSSWRPVLTMSLLSITIFEFLCTTKAIKFVSYTFVSGSVVLCLLIFAEYYREIINLDFNRLGELFGDLNAIGLIITTGCTFSIFLLFFDKGNLFKKLFNCLILLLLAVFVALTGSRGAFLTLVISLLVFSFVFMWGKNKLFLILCAIIVVGIALFIFFVPAFKDFRDRIIGSLITIISGDAYADTSTSGRLNMMAEALEIWTTNPLFGYGAEAFFRLSNQAAWSHSTFSELLCSYGSIGTLFWAFPMVFYCFAKNKLSRQIGVSFMLGYILPSSLSFVLHIAKYPSAAMGVFMAICFIYNQQNEYAIDIKFSSRRFIKFALLRPEPYHYFYEQ